MKTTQVNKKSTAVFNV